MSRRQICCEKVKPAHADEVYIILSTRCKVLKLLVELAPCWSYRRLQVVLYVLRERHRSYETQVLHS